MNLINLDLLNPVLRLFLPVSIKARSFTHGANLTLVNVRIPLGLFIQDAENQLN